MAVDLHEDEPVPDEFFVATVLWTLWIASVTPFDWFLWRTTCGEVSGALISATDELVSQALHALNDKSLTGGSAGSDDKGTGSSRSHSTIKSSTEY
eukprot:3006115-Amphidinium_carterae.1